ncbi:MAG: DUF2892 domain-containing protein [Propionibacteriaceae bacterium]|jgi:hypothetical protein|nr:DUF2892 domain-containing protein [Propionibacteriaceae bacterium]
MTLLTFFSTPAGRWTRAIAGVVLIAVGALLGGWWFLLAALGLVFVLVGALDVCLLAPLFGKPLRGKDFRSAQSA